MGQFFAAKIRISWHFLSQRKDFLPKNGVVFEDSENGILAAHSAGIPVICIPDLKYPDKENLKSVFFGL